MGILHVHSICFQLHYLLLRTYFVSDPVFSVKDSKNKAKENKDQFWSWKSSQPSRVDG